MNDRAKPRQQPEGYVAPAGGHTAILAAMRQPDTYPHATTAFEYHETHLSWVFLAGNFAYKLKKPIAVGFVDFSTVERRAAACMEEVRLNRQLCPTLYLGVTDLVLRGPQLHLGGRGQPIEPVVKMRRLPSEQLLPALIERYAATASMIRRIANKLADFHTRTATGAGVDEWGTPAAIRANWLDNFEQTRSISTTLLPTAIVKTVRTFVEQFMDTQENLLHQRVATGRIRDCHGDLHAANVCIGARTITLFDRLEFDARYRCADVVAEVAFLAMDLAARGRADLAQILITTYQQASADAALTKLLPFYSSYRAWIRGKVAALRLAEPDLSAADRAAIHAEMRRYFTLAWAYAGGFTQPCLIMTIGLPASGKTRLATALASHLGLVQISSDLVRKELAGQRPTDHQPSQELYSAAMGRRTYATMRRRAARYLRQGNAVILDATFGSVHERRAVAQLAARIGVPLIILYCQADDATLQSRLAARDDDPLTVSDARLANWPILRTAFTPPDQTTELTVLDMTATFSTALTTALAALGVPQ